MQDVEEARRAFTNSHAHSQPYDEGAASTPPTQTRALGFSSTFSAGHKRISLGAVAATNLAFSSSFNTRSALTTNAADLSSHGVNPRVAQALKEITTSPSPKVSALVEQIKEKVKRNEAAAQRYAQLQRHRSAMLADAAKVGSRLGVEGSAFRVYGFGLAVCTAARPFSPWFTSWNLAGALGIRLL